MANVYWTQWNCLVLWDKCSLYNALDLSEISWHPPRLWSWHKYFSQVSAKLVISVWLPQHIRNTAFHHPLLFSSKTLYTAQHPLGNQSKYNVFTASICHLECMASLHGKFPQVHISLQNESLSTLTLESPFYHPLALSLSHMLTHCDSQWCCPTNIFIEDASGHMVGLYLSPLWLGRALWLVLNHVT